MRPLNPADGVVECFACELRALRAAAGEPPFSAMARRCEVSKSALAEAVAGYELPSERVAQAFVRACGGNWDWWSRRLGQARAQFEVVEAALVADGSSSTTPSTELVLVTQSPLLQAMTRSDLVVRPRFLPVLPVRFAVRGRASQRRKVLVASLAAVVIAASALVVILSPEQNSAVPAKASRFYDQTIGPGCPNSDTALVSQGDFKETHKWTQATATDWTVPNCSNLLVYSATTGSSDPNRWQDEYDWYFDNVPRTSQCTFHVYIPDSSDATYTAAYDWTAGDTNYLDANAFVIDQSAYRGSWFTQGPHVFSTGQARLFVTDARSDAPNASLAAAAVRLTCA